MLQRGLLKVAIVAGTYLLSPVLRLLNTSSGLGNGSGTGGAAAYEGYAVALISRGSESLNALASSIKESGGQLTAEDIRESNNINIESSFAFARAAILTFQQNEATSSTGKGTLVFTGATASVRGNVTTSGFASAKFAVRALAESLAKEFGQQDIHAIIDGMEIGPIENPTPESKLSPESIAAAYLYLVNQDRAAWTWELDLRPAHENW
ncbi:hypothetical protein B0H16DRAFT_1833077 [Mycena metata]|uniref:Short-chain dehydrogenase/reductase SDR n=1 Tax=Mycena metata TaxID=1033252 RepID=A0AAD7NCH9_9AGAR|nr:hypothetical protein B0H16DRAFT_1833077 [Mycena metata]